MALPRRYHKAMNMWCDSSPAPGLMTDRGKTNGPKSAN